MSRRNRLPTSTLIASGFALWAGFGACGEEPRDARTSWVQTNLCNDLHATLVRDPSAVADKLALMADEPFIYFRGTLALWHADQYDAAGLAREPSAITVPEAEWILLVGDPHPENAGTFRVPGPGGVQAEPGDGGAMTIEWNDFDAASWGPWIHDLRRLATGVALVWDEAPLDDADRARAIDAVVAGYAAGLVDPDALDPLPRFASELVARAEVAGGDRTELRALDHDAPLPTFVEDDRFVPPTAAEEALVRDLMAQWSPGAAAQGGLPEDLRAVILRGEASAIARRLGVGIASFALRRFDVWYGVPELEFESESESEPESESESVGGLMIEFKEVAPAPHWALPSAYAYRAFASPAAGSVAAEQALQREPRGDALLAFAVGPDASYRVRERTAYQKGFERERLWSGLSDGALTADDAAQFAHYLGRLLGQAHARSPRLEGGTAQTALLARLGDPATRELLTRETHAFAERMADLTRADRASLERLVREEGPLIGCRP